MSDLRKAAEEVLERWDSPAWEWTKQGPTAELMATLRAALAAPRPEPVAYFDPQKREFYWARPTQIDAPTTVAVSPLPLYAAAPTAAPSEDIESLRRENERLQNLLYDQIGKVTALRATEQMRKQIAELKHAENERLRGLLAEAQKAVWMNYDSDLLDRIEAALKEVPR